MKRALFVFLAIFASLLAVASFIALTTHDATTALDDEFIVYETEVESEDDCSSFEAYDAETQVCYFECTTESECEEILLEIDAELESWATTLEDQGHTFSEDILSQEDFLALFAVTESEKIELIQGEPSPEYQSLWQEVADLSPDFLSNEFIEHFAVYSDESSDTLAYVSDEDANGKWLIAVNLAAHTTSTVREQKSTIIHELAHILTLNSSQIRSVYENCDTYEISEGCARDTSYLYSFFYSFWKDLQDQAFSPDLFVTEYATTNTEEDLAESFAFFILESTVVDSTVRDQKVRFFSQYPELATIRSEMRQVLAKEILRQKKLN
jgi:hypothetical protein